MRRGAPARPRRAALRAAAALTLTALLTSPSAPSAAAQEMADSAAIARAAAIRDTLRRPPAEPPFDAIDAAGLPLRIVGFPLELLVRGLGELAGLVTAPGPPPFYIEAYRALDEWGATPVVDGEIGPRSGLAGGLHLHRFDPFWLETAYSVRGSQRHRAGVRLGSRARGLGLRYGWHRDAEVSFWGIGPETADRDRSDFLHDRSDAELEGRLRATPEVRLAAAFGYEDNRIDRGSDGSTPDLQDAFDPAALFGAAERTEYLRWRAGVRFDLTRRREFQTRGVALDLAATLFRGIGGTDSDFHRLQAELRGYLPLNRRQLLAVRAQSEVNGSDGGAGVPFFHLAALGGSESARGFTDSRFRDRAMVSLMTEWRWEIWRELHDRSRVELFLFFDEGAVEDALDALDSSDFRASWGFGGRLAGTERLAGLLYLGFSDEETRVGFRTDWEF